MNRMNRVQDEIDYRIQHGQTRCTIHGLEQLYRALGYRFDRSLDCRGAASYMTGPRAGISYPCLTLYPVQIDNGLSAFHVDARRDAQFLALQTMRNTHFAVCAQGAIVEV